MSAWKTTFNLYMVNAGLNIKTKFSKYYYKFTRELTGNIKSLFPLMNMRKVCRVSVLFRWYFLSGFKKSRLNIYPIK
jgi:hypothetical protein